MRVPTPMRISPSFSTRKRSQGGVMASRFLAAAKKGKTCSGGAGSQSS
jgi:hypothetical protein